MAAPGTYSEDWVQLAPSSAPAIREGAAVFYDSVRNQTILFGGTSSGTPLGDTYSWNGTNWTALSPASSPPVRGYAAAAFDPVHQQGVLFGGSGNGGPLSDTWLWNGTTWTLATPVNLPSVRSSAMMAWDGHHIVMFGGNQSGNEIGDTWTWDGTNWTSVATAVPPAAPSPRDSGGMAFDSIRNQVVLFGGENGNFEEDFGDTWIWNGATMTWAQASPANSPAARDSFTMAFDPLRGETVLFGGFAQVSVSSLSDTWEWNGTTWTLLSTPHKPSARYYYAMAYDVSHSDIVLLGGASPGSSTFDLNDTWVLEGPYVSSLVLPEGTQNAPYGDTIAVQGGISPVTFGAPTLPPGITLNATTGAFGGAPTAVSTYNIPVTIQDSAGVSIAPAFSLTVSAALSLQGTTLPNATAATNYLVQLVADGGVPPYNYSATGLPTGLQLTGDLIAGQCTASSTNVMLQVTDSATPAPNVASVGPLTVTCNAFPAITSTSPLADGIVNKPYSATIQMTGGTGPIAWSLTPGTLPSGFTLSSTGVLTGTGTTPVSAQFSVTITDFWNAAVTVPFTLNIESVLTITSTSLPSGVPGRLTPAESHWG